MIDLVGKAFYRKIKAGLLTSPCGEMSLSVFLVHSCAVNSRNLGRANRSNIRGPPFNLHREIILTLIPKCLTNVYSGNVSGALKFTSIFLKHYLSINMWVRKEPLPHQLSWHLLLMSQDLTWIWYLCLQNVRAFKTAFPLRKILGILYLPETWLSFFMLGRGYLVSSAPGCSHPTMATRARICG